MPRSVCNILRLSFRTPSTNLFAIMAIKLQILQLVITLVAAPSMAALAILPRDIDSRGIHLQPTSNISRSYLLPRASLGSTDVQPPMLPRDEDNISLLSGGSSLDGSGSSNAIPFRRNLYEKKQHAKKKKNQKSSSHYDGKERKNKKRSQNKTYFPTRKSGRTRSHSWLSANYLKLSREKVLRKANHLKIDLLNRGRQKARNYGILRNPTTWQRNVMLNHIDRCWRRDPNWENNRMHLADCAIGYGSNALGGKGGQIYVVTDPSDNDPSNPKPGTLRYGVVQLRPIWIIFARDMKITLENELIITSYTTIDGRGANVEIADGPCLTIQDVQHVIIHGLTIHRCTPGKSGRVMSSTDHVGQRQGSDGDAIAMFGATNIWIDHNYFAECADGLVDAIHGSTDITISNNYFTNHDKVMLLGHSDSYTQDKYIRVTVVYNHFGPGLVQRMPRCRFGHFHVANNRYTKWELYALGASEEPTILSEGNYFLAPDNADRKQVIKLEGDKQTSSSCWKSKGDLFLNGAYFGEQGTSSFLPDYLHNNEGFFAYPGVVVPSLTANAGPLQCRPHSPC